MRTAAICPTCAFYTNAKCIIYDGEYIPCFDINNGDSLEYALQQIAKVICPPTTTTTTTNPCEIEGESYENVSTTTTTTIID